MNFVTHDEKPSQNENMGNAISDWVAKWKHSQTLAEGEEKGERLRCVGKTPLMSLFDG